MGKLDAPVSVRVPYAEDAAQRDRDLYGVWPPGCCPRCGADPTTMKIAKAARERNQGRPCPSIGRMWQCPLPAGHEGICID